MRIVTAALGILKAIIGLLLGFSLVGLLFFQRLPLGAPSPALVEFPLKSVTDMHVHIAGLGYGGSGCFVSPDLGESYKRYFYFFAFGVSEKQLQQYGDAYLVEQLSEKISHSKYTKDAVILALDAVFDTDGLMQRKQTQIYVPNEFVRDQSQRFDNLRYGASIHPFRKDAIERLRQAKRDGAVLVKWIPSIMLFSPGDKKLIPFYKELAALDIPLLTHAGQERSFSYAIDEFGDPQLLELPLSLGVKVIAAHIATTGKIDKEEMIDRLLPMFERYPNLYGDISSLTQINKLGYVDQALLNQSLFSRVLYGSDWPLQFFPVVSAWLHLPRLSLADIQTITAEPSPFDRDVLLKAALGLPREVFEQTPTILNIPNHKIKINSEVLNYSDPITLDRH